MMSWRGLQKIDPQGNIDYHKNMSECCMHGGHLLAIAFPKFYERRKFPCLQLRKTLYRMICIANNIKQT